MPIWHRLFWYTDYNLCEHKKVAFYIRFFKNEILTILLKGS